LGLGAGGAPGIDQFWPIAILRLYKIAHFSMENCELSPQFTVAKSTTQPAVTSNRRLSESRQARTRFSVKRHL
jgi:hypothetical protein